MTTPETIFGIDLGTTHSLVAYLGPDGPTVLRDERGEALVPSAIAVDDTGALLTGSVALERAHHRPEQGAVRFKCDMGGPIRHQLAEHDLGPVELSALVLRDLAAMSEAQLGHPMKRVVITVPAWFAEPQRSATREAAELAGLDVVRILNEPTAAAMAHGLHDSDTERTAVVVDLGGGTFDVSVLEYFEGVMEVVASAGDSRLGGEDFTDSLVAWALDRAGLHAIAFDNARLRVFRGRCEVAKRKLSERDEVTLEVPSPESDGWRVHSTLTVRRSDLELATAALLGRLRTGLGDALRQARLRADQVDEVVLVGGATRMPAIRRLAAKVFGRMPRIHHDPDLLVALGAAVAAGLADGDQRVRDLVVTDVVPHTLGVEIARDAGDQLLSGYYMPVIHRNTTLPVRRVESVSTLHSKQRSVKVRIFQGEHRFASQNRLLGEFEVTGIPVSDDDESRQSVELAFTHDLNGLLEVEARVVSSGETAAVLIEQHAGRMSDEERARAVAALGRLKTHPRDLLPNRHLLERAHHLYARLPHEAQATLDPALLDFEAALERQDGAALPTAASQLRRVVEHLEEAHG